MRELCGKAAGAVRELCGSCAEKLRELCGSCAEKLRELCGKLRGLCGEAAEKRSAGALSEKWGGRHLQGKTRRTLSHSTLAAALIITPRRADMPSPRH